MIETWHSILDYRGVLRDEGARISAAEDRTVLEALCRMCSVERSRPIACRSECRSFGLICCVRRPASASVARPS